MESPTRRIALIGFPELQQLDVCGPLEVFSVASRWLDAKRQRPATRPTYRTELVARERGAVRASSGLRLGVDRALPDVRGELDTLLVAGGLGVEAALGDPALLRGIERLAGRARRVASVCTGAFLLAELGILDGRRATTHWAACEDLARRYPRVKVDPDPIFVRDGHIATSAGVTAGMDLALGLVEEDFGRRLSLQVARSLVLFLRRPGGQSQFSAHLASQMADHEPLREIQGWITDHPDADLSVPSLARRAAMSPRNFARVFTREVGTTPARFVERARLEAARRALEESDRGVDEVAAECGFGSAETMRRAFLRGLRVSPADYRRRFQRRAS